VSLTLYYPIITNYIVSYPANFSWQKTVERLQVSAKQRRDEKNRAEKELEDAEDIESMAFKGLRHRGVIPGASTTMADDIQSIVENPAKMKEFLNKKRGSRSRKPMDRLMSLLRDGMKLGYSLAGKNTSEVDESTVMKFVSPRFMSVIPEAESSSNKASIEAPIVTCSCTAKQRPISDRLPVAIPLLTAQRGSGGGESDQHPQPGAGLLLPGPAGVAQPDNGGCRCGGAG